MKKKTKLVPPTTNNITKAIINFLRSNGHSASRINTQGQYDSDKRVWRKSGSRNGFFDIVACVKGRYVTFDIKKGKDSLSPDQISYMKEVIKAGGIAIAIETMEQFYNWYNDSGL